MALPVLTWPDDVPVLTRGDVTLRAHRLDDADAVVEQCTDPASVRWTTVPLGYDRATADAWLAGAAGAGWADGSEHSFAIECTHPDGRRRFAGSVSLRDEGDRRAELAFGVHPAVRGRGVCGAAVDLLLDHGFGTLGLETVVWWAEVGNLGSRKVAWRAGFTLGGSMHRWLDHRGAHVDAWVGTLHRDDPRTAVSPWYDTPTLTTRRLRLRPWGDDDADRVVEAASDPRTRQFLPDLPSPYTREHALTYLRGGAGDVLRWAVTARTGGPVLAAVGLPRVSTTSAELGYWTHPDARGRGVMTEAVGAVADWLQRPAGAGGLGRRRVCVRVAAGNTASEQAAVANGFVRCGRERSGGTLRDGTVVDLLVLDRVVDAAPAS